MGVAETQATLKAQVLGVCRLYYSQVWNESLKQAGVEASSDLWKMENVYYPPAIREIAAASSEAEVALEEAETARPEAALAITVPDEPTKESELSGTAESTANAQALHAEELALPIEPLQIIPPSEGSKDPEVVSTQLSNDGIKIKLQK